MLSDNTIARMPLDEIVLELITLTLFGELLVDVLYSRKMTYRDVISQVDEIENESTISNWVHGISLPQPDVLHSIGVGLELTDTEKDDLFVAWITTHLLRDLGKYIQFAPDRDQENAYMYVKCIIIPNSNQHAISVSDTNVFQPARFIFFCNLLNCFFERRRKNSNINQPSLAREMNVATSTLNSWLNNKRFPDPSSLHTISRGFCLDITQQYQLFHSWVGTQFLRKGWEYIDSASIEFKSQAQDLVWGHSQTFGFNTKKFKNSRDFYRWLRDRR